MALAIEELSEARWRAECELFEDFNYCQEWSYVNEMAKLQRSVTEFLAIRNDEGIVGLAAIRVRRVPLVRTGFAILSRGPLVLLGGKPGPAQLDAVLSALRQRYVQERRLCLWVHPTIQHSLCTDERIVEFAGWNSLRESVDIPYRTYVLDLSHSLEELRARLHKKWRRHLKLSEGRDLSVDIGASDSLLSRFDQLYEQLRKRKSFESGRLPDAIHAVAKSWEDQTGYQVMIARRGSEDLAGVILSLHGRVGVYLLGASSDAGLGTDASYFLQWKAVEICKARQLRFYDLGGIDVGRNPGVERFKRRMGGDEIGVGAVRTLLPNGVAGLMSRVLQRLVGR